MSDLWNFWDVKPPPVCSVQTDLHFKGISDLNEIAHDALQTLRDVAYLDKEAAVLSRFLYKHQRIFRHDKGIQNLVKVNQCLKKYRKLDMAGVVFTFKQTLPFRMKKPLKIAYLPTKQMLKWVLLRLQAFAQLFVRVTELTKITGAYIYERMCLGWSLNLSLLVFSMTARLLAASKFLVAKSIEWYDSFHKCLPYLQETADFLPDYDFPVDLKLWLGKVDLVPLKKKTFADDIFELIDLASEGEEEEEDYDEVKIIKEKFIKTLLKAGATKTDSDVEEIPVKGAEETKRAVKRPLKKFPLGEDLGVPVDEGEDDDEVPEHAYRRPTKRKGGRRLKWLKKVKKTLNDHEKKGTSKTLLPGIGFSNDSKVPFLTID